jgi:membrane protein required for colicin V production
MHWLDFVLILVLGVGGLLGLRSGLLWQVARIVIFAAAVYCCIQYHDIPVAWIKDNFTGLTPVTTALVAYIVTFLGVCLAGFLITFFLESLLRAAHLKLIDRLLGGVFGVLKAALLCGGVLTGIVLYGPPQSKEVIADSTLAPQMLEGMRYVLALVPEKVKEELSHSIQEIKKQHENLSGSSPRSTTATP